MFTDRYTIDEMQYIAIIDTIAMKHNTSIYFFSHKKYRNLQQKYSMIRQETDLMLVYCDTRLLILDSTLVVIGI